MQILKYWELNIRIGCVRRCQGCGCYKSSWLLICFITLCFLVSSSALLQCFLLLLLLPAELWLQDDDEVVRVHSGWWLSWLRSKKLKYLLNSHMTRWRQSDEWTMESHASCPTISYFQIKNISIWFLLSSILRNTSGTMSTILVPLLNFGYVLTSLQPLCPLHVIDSV